MFTVTIENVADEDLAKWLLQKDGMTLAVSGEQISDKDNVVEIIRDDMNGTWGVAFRSAKFPVEKDRVVFQTLFGDIVLPVSTRERTAIQKLEDACR